MQLLYAPTSPYVRKVMVSAHLLGLADHIACLPSAAHPLVRDERIASHNPLAKVPTLRLDDGRTLFDSRVICEYLDSLRPGYGLFPASGDARWDALRRQALGDGLLDAALLARYEYTARPADKQWQDWHAAQLLKVQACLLDIEGLADRLAKDPLTIGEVTIGCALSYLDFRFPALAWRDSCPAAAGWHAAVQALPAMQATYPFEPRALMSDLAPSTAASHEVWFLNGPNANLYGLDTNKVYGSDSFPSLKARCEAKAASLGLALNFVQSNWEGQLVDWIQEARGAARGVIINAAGLSYSSVPILDALLSFPGKIIEVHMSNIWRRESFRHHSYISRAADGVIAGLGGDGYEFAIEAMSRLISR